MSNYMDVLEIWAFWGSKFSSLPISILVFLSRYLSYGKNIRLDVYNIVQKKTYFWQK